MVFFRTLCKLYLIVSSVSAQLIVSLPWTAKVVQTVRVIDWRTCPGQPGNLWTFGESWVEVSSDMEGLTRPYIAIRKIDNMTELHPLPPTLNQ